MRITKTRILVLIFLYLIASFTTSGSPFNWTHDGIHPAHVTHKYKIEFFEDYRNKVPPIHAALEFSGKNSHRSSFSADYPSVGESINQTFSQIAQSYLIPRSSLCDSDLISGGACGFHSIIMGDSCPQIKYYDAHSSDISGRPILGVNYRRVCPTTTSTYDASSATCPHPLRPELTKLVQVPHGQYGAGNSISDEAYDAFCIKPEEGACIEVIGGQIISCSAGNNDYRINLDTILDNTQSIASINQNLSATSDRVNSVEFEILQLDEITTENRHIQDRLTVLNSNDVELSEKVDEVTSRQDEIESSIEDNVTEIEDILEQTDELESSIDDNYYDVTDLSDVVNGIGGLAENNESKIYHLDGALTVTQTNLLNVNRTASIAQSIASENFTKLVDHANNIDTLNEIKKNQEYCANLRGLNFSGDYNFNDCYTDGPYSCELISDPLVGGYTATGSTCGEGRIPESVFLANGGGGVSPDHVTAVVNAQTAHIDNRFNTLDNSQSEQTQILNENKTALEEVNEKLDTSLENQEAIKDMLDGDGLDNQMSEPQYTLIGNPQTEYPLGFQGIFDEHMEIIQESGLITLADSFVINRMGASPPDWHVPLPMDKSFDFVVPNYIWNFIASVVAFCTGILARNLIFG